MKTSEQLKLRGEFHLQIFNEAGEVVETYEDKNLIVDTAFGFVTQLLGGALSGDFIDLIEVGSNGTAPAPGDTAITAPSFSKAFGSVTYPSNNEVNFNWTLELSEANGINIAEYGLVCSTTTPNPTLFARKTRGAIAKDATMRLVGVWKIFV